MSKQLKEATDFAAWILRRDKKKTVTQVSEIASRKLGVPALKIAIELRSRYEFVKRQNNRW